jgi:hypothetical protein
MSDLLEDGIIFFNAGRFFDAHEAWEDLWRETGGPLRLFYQGLVQTAVGLHHLGQGNLNGARAQLSKALSKLEQYPPTFCQIDNGKLVEDIRDLLGDLKPREILIVRM